MLIIVNNYDDMAFIECVKDRGHYLDLKVADYLKKPVLGNFDVVVASGILNSNLGKVDTGSFPQNLNKRSTDSEKN